MARELATRKNIYPWMDICLCCVNKLENDEDEEVEMEIDNDDDAGVFSILRSFVDVEDNWIPIRNIDLGATFGPGRRITAETIFF